MVAKESAAEEPTAETGPADQDATGTPGTAGTAAEPRPVAGTAARTTPRAAETGAEGSVGRTGERDARQRTARASPQTATAGDEVAADTGRQTAGDQATRRAERTGTAQNNKTGANKVAARKSTTDRSSEPGAVPSARTAAAAAPGELAVREGEDPWTQEEVDAARDELTSEADRLRAEVVATEEALTGLMRDSGDGAGDDQADAGTKNVTREHEMALASNAREMLYQTERALERLEAGTYGRCESCGNPIGKARMQAFPRATLCVDCKQREERRG